MEFATQNWVCCLKMPLNEVCTNARERLLAVNHVSAHKFDNVVSLVLLRRYAGENGDRHEKIRQIDNLVIEKYDPSQFSTDFSRLRVKNDTFKLFGISKQLSLDWLQATGVSFWVEAQVINGQVVGGWEGEFVTLDRKDNPLTYILFLKKKPDETQYT